MSDFPYLLPYAWTPHVSCEHSFSAGHRLPNHTGKCKYIHGHNYRATVSVGVEMTRANIETQGFVIDFGVLKQIVRQQLAPFDHAFFVWQSDPLLHLLNASENGIDVGHCGGPPLGNIWRPIVTEAPPTAEVLSKLMLHLIGVELAAYLGRAFVLSFKLSETDRNTVVVTEVIKP